MMIRVKRYFQFVSGQREAWRLVVVHSVRAPGIAGLACSRPISFCCLQNNACTSIDNPVYRTLWCLFIALLLPPPHLLFCNTIAGTSIDNPVYRMLWCLLCCALAGTAYCIALHCIAGDDRGGGQRPGRSGERRRILPGYAQTGGPLGRFGQRRRVLSSVLRRYMLCTCLRFL